MLLTRTKLTRFFFQTLATNRAALALHFLGTTGIQLIFYAGLSYLGGWSLVGQWGWIMAAVALMPLFLLGWSQGLIKIIPELSEDQVEKRMQAASTALLGSILIPIVVALLVFVVSLSLPQRWWDWLPHIPLDTSYRVLLVIGLLLIPINLTIQQLLDAREAFVFRTVTQGHGLLFLVVLSLGLYPWLALHSLAVGLFAQQLVITTRGLRILRFLNAIPSIPQMRWNKHVAHELFQFGIRYLQTSMLSALFEPITKAAITRMGGLDWVGMYEFASRIILPLRNILVQQLQVLTPQLAKLRNKNLQQPLIRESMIQHTKHTFWIFLAASSILSILAIVSADTFNRLFLQSMGLLFLIWTINLFAVPLYYTAMARGKLHHLAIVHLLQTGTAALCWWQPTWVIDWTAHSAISLVIPSAGVVLGAIYLIAVYRSWLPYTAFLREWKRELIGIIGIALMVGCLFLTAWSEVILAALCLVFGVWTILGRRQKQRPFLSEEDEKEEAQTVFNQPVKISVITVCLNRAHYIRDTIQSVQAQSYPHVEHIIVDGGSTDGTLEILQEYQSHIATWISEPDQNMYDAINKGCRLASGDYIHILNSDDYLAGPDVYLEIVKYIESSGRQALYHGDLIKVRDGQSRYMHLFGAAYLPYLFSKHGTFISHPTVLIRRDVHEKLGGYRIEYPFSSDYDYLLRASQIAAPQGSMHLPLGITCFREHGNSATYSGMLNNDKKPILASHGFYLYPIWYRLVWWLWSWAFYKWQNPRKRYHTVQEPSFSSRNILHRSSGTVHEKGLP